MIRHDIVLAGSSKPRGRGKAITHGRGATPSVGERSAGLYVKGDHESFPTKWFRCANRPRYEQRAIDAGLNTIETDVYLALVRKVLYSGINRLPESTAAIEWLVRGGPEYDRARHVVVRSVLDKMFDQRTDGWYVLPDCIAEIVAVKNRPGRVS